MPCVPGRRSDCAIPSPSLQGTRQVTRAAVEFYGPNRAKWLGPFSEGDVPSYLKGEMLRRRTHRV